MALLTSLITGAVGIAAIAAIFFFLGSDVDATLAFLSGNWSTVLLGIQMVAAYILTASGHRLAGAVLTGSALLTVVGKVIALD